MLIIFEVNPSDMLPVASHVRPVSQWGLEVGSCFCSTVSVSTWHLQVIPTTKMVSAKSIAGGICRSRHFTHNVSATVRHNPQREQRDLKLLMFANGWLNKHGGVFYIPPPKSLVSGTRGGSSLMVIPFTSNSDDHSHLSIFNKNVGSYKHLVQGNSTVCNFKTFNRHKWPNESCFKQNDYTSKQNILIPSLRTVREVWATLS